MREEVSQRASSLVYLFLSLQLLTEARELQQQLRQVQRTLEQTRENHRRAMAVSTTPPPHPTSPPTHVSLTVVFIPHRRRSERKQVCNPHSGQWTNSTISITLIVQHCMLRT